MKLAFIIIIVALLVVLPAAAQSDDTAVQPETVITVIGQIVNGTAGAETPGDVEIMLHIMDVNFNEKNMLHGVTDGDGRFQFDDVPYQPEWLYAVMASYQDATYFSTPMTVLDAETTLELEIPVFEATDDVSAVQVESMHLFFDTDQGGLMVGEIYSFSNLGDRTVVGAAGLDDGTPATLRLTLPPDAASVNFRDSQGRFFLTEDGFADTAPLLPGMNSGQVVVTYILPYEDGISLERTAVFPTKEINILLPTSLGITLDDAGYIAKGQRDMGNGFIVDVYSLEDVAAGTPITIDLSGTLAVSGTDPMNTVPEAHTNKGLAIGMVLLGMAVIGVGIWWYRRPVPEEEEFPEAFEEIVQKIALLDAAHDEHEIDNETYQSQRAALREQAQAVLARSGD
ncbi:MAG: hypothetical protein Kow0080_00180 [Candidatus Promineifilaceae bacterium]